MEALLTVVYDGGGWRNGGVDEQAAAEGGRRLAGVRERVVHRHRHRLDDGRGDGSDTRRGLRFLSVLPPATCRTK